MKKFISAIAAAAVVCLVAGTLPADAASPLANLPIGQSVAYHTTFQSQDQNGPQSGSYNIRFTRSGPTTIAVALDGAPAGTITLNADGTPNVPPNLQKPLAPFGQIATMMRGAPGLAQGTVWPMNLPVPIQDQTDNVPVTMTVRTAGVESITISGTGSNTTQVQPGGRKFPADVSVNTTIVLGAAHTITSANSSVAINIHMGLRDRRDKQFGSSWTITQLKQ